MADESVLNMSLDDIIQQKSKSKKPTASRKKAGERENKEGRGKGRLRVSIGQAGIRKGQSRSRTIQNGQGARARVASEDQPRDPEALNGNAAWEHDLYEEGQPQARRIRPAASGHKILISNLDYKVTDEDIQELFENCGPILKAGILYDRSGRSEEAAEIIFENRQDAVAAVKQYNNLALDNKAMKIELIEGGGAGGQRMLSSGLRLGGRVGGPRAVSQARPSQNTRQVKRFGNRKERTSSQARGRGAAISMTDLDKDLDSYMTTE